MTTCIALAGRPADALKLSSRRTAPAEPVLSGGFTVHVLVGWSTSKGGMCYASERLEVADNSTGRVTRILLEDSLLGRTGSAEEGRSAGWS